MQTTDDEDMTTAVIEGVLEGLRAGGAASTGDKRAGVLIRQSRNQSRNPAGAVDDTGRHERRRGIEREAGTVQSGRPRTLSTTC